MTSENHPASRSAVKQTVVFRKYQDFTILKENEEFYTEVIKYNIRQIFSCSGIEVGNFNLTFSFSIENTILIKELLHT